ncbi:MAG: magnesium transporter CorA family protein [Formosimonas sp.]
MMSSLYFKQTMLGEHVTWLDVHRTDVERQPVAWLHMVREQFGVAIDELHLTDLLNVQHPSFFDQTNDYDILIFRKLRSAARDLSTTPVVFIMAGHLLITVRDAHSPTFDAIYHRLNSKLDAKRQPASAIELTLRLLNVMIDQYLELRMPLTQRIEQWQTELLQGSHRFHHWQALLQESSILQQLENLCEEQLDALQELRDNYLDQHAQESNVRHDLMLVRITDLVEHVTRVQSHASRLQRALKSAIDLHFSATANQTNETMRFLAILTAIFAPLTLLTGIYGMNFDVIPGLHNPYGFWWLLGGMLATTVSLLYYFRRRSLVGRGNKSIAQLLSEKQDLS